MTPPDSPLLGGSAPPATPVQVGRVRPKWTEWLVLLVAVGVAWPLWNWRGHVDRPGAVVDAPITLLVSDRENLSCALDRFVGSFRCRFRAPGKPWPESLPTRDILAPYVTAEHRMYLVPGLFELPALAARCDRESPANVPPASLRRFVARCKLRLVERVELFQARWSENGGWGKQSGAWVAEPIACEIE
jgi:hypothetical protein